MDEDEENKGRHVRQKKRRSSILKLPLTGIDPNTQIKEKEVKKKRLSSKRVSFAETLDVWEFNKEFQPENSDKSAFQNNDDKEITGIDSLLTGEIIKNPAPAVEQNISDPEDSGEEEEEEEEEDVLKCSVYQPVEKDLMQNGSSNANKMNIDNVDSSPNSVNSTDVSPANQSMYCLPDMANTLQKSDNKLFFQQLMQKMKTSPNPSPDNSPVMTVACRPSMSNTKFIENLLQDTKDYKISFSPDISMETSTSASPALDKSLYYIESSKPIDTTIHFNCNSDQTAGMDFTICNGKLFSDSFKAETLSGPEKESPVNMTQCFTNMDDTNAKMELTVCAGNYMAPIFNISVPKQNLIQKNTTSTQIDDMTINFGSNPMQNADMELTKCYDQLLSGCSRIEHKDDDDASMKQKLTSHGNVTRIFNQAEDLLADMKMKLGTTPSSISFLDGSSKPECGIVRKENETETETDGTNRESKSCDTNLVEGTAQTNKELTSCAMTKIPMYPTCTKKVLNEDRKENILPSVASHHSDEMQIDKFHSDEMNSMNSEVNSLRLNQKDTVKIQGNDNLNLDYDKQSIIKAGSESLTEKTISSVSFIELPVKKTSLISDVVNTGSTNIVKKTMKRVSYMCTEELPKNESRLSDEDEPPIKKLSSSNQVDLYSQKSGSTDFQHQLSIKNQSENNVSFTDDVISKRKSGVKKVSLYDPEKVLNMTSEEPPSKKILLENVPNQMDMESATIDQEKPSSLKTLFPVSTERNSFIGASSNLKLDTHSQETTASTDNGALKSVKSLHISMNTSGILKSFNEDNSKYESIHDDLPKPLERQTSSFIVGEKRSTDQLAERSSNIPDNPDLQSTKSSSDIVSKSQNCLNRSRVLKTLFTRNGIGSELVDKDLTKTSEKRVNFFLTDERLSEEKDIRSNADLLSTTLSPEEMNKCVYTSANTSGILKPFVNQDDCPDDKTVDKNLVKILERRVDVCSANEQLSEKNTLDTTSPIAEPQSEKSPEVNKYLYISLNNSGSIKSFSLDENCLGGQPMDENLNKSVKRMDEGCHSAKEEASGSKPGIVDQGQLPTCIVGSPKTIIGKPEPISASCGGEPFDNVPTLNRLEKSVSHHAEKIPLSDHMIAEDSSKKEKETIVQVSDLVRQPIVGSVDNQLNLADIPKTERLAKVPHFKTSWQGMFSIENVIKNVKQSRSASIPVASCEPTRTASVPAVNIMQHTVSLSENSKQTFSTKDPSQDKVSDVAIEMKEKVKNTYLLNMVADKFTSEPKATNVKPVVADSVLSASAPGNNSHHAMIPQLVSQGANGPAIKISSSSKAPKDESDKPENNLSVDENDFQMDDLSGIMNEQCDILIDMSHCENTVHVGQNQFSSILGSSRPSFSNKSVDDVRNSSLCNRMLINVHFSSSAKKLSALEVESIEELLLFIGIDKLENVTLDFCRSSVDSATPEFENMALGEKLVLSCLEHPEYQSILETYESLKADEHNLFREFHSQKLLQDFQFALKQKDSKSNDELKNELIEDFKKSRRLSDQKVKQRKADRYENLCSVFKNKLVVLKEAKSQVDDISQKIDQQLERLDEALYALDKEFDHLDSLSQRTDEDLEQYAQVRQYLDYVNKIQLHEQKLSNQCCQLIDEEKSLMDQYSGLEICHANLLKPVSLDTSALLKNCQKLKIYSVISPWRVWQLQDDRQKYNFWNDTFQFCIHTQAESIEKAHFELDENWQTVVKDQPWIQIAHEIRQNAMQEKCFLDSLQNISQLPQLLHRIGNFLNSLQDLAKEIHAVSLKKVITRQQNSILVTYCSTHLSKVQVCFQFDPINYPTATINHQVNLHYGNVRCQDISRKLQKVKPGAQYLTRLVNAVQLESIST